MIVVGYGLTAVAVGAGAAAIGIAALGIGVLVLAAGAITLGAGLTLCGAGLTMIAATGEIAANGMATLAVTTAAAFVPMVAGTASCLALDVALVSLMIPLGALTIELGLSAAACGALALAMESTAISVTTIENSAASAAQSLSDMVSSVDVVKAGLDGLGDYANSAVQGVVNSLTSGGPEASAAAGTMATDITNRVKVGLEPIPQETNSTMLSMNGAITTGMTQANSTIRTGFSSAVSYILGLAGQSYSWGADMMQGLINGIYSRMSPLRSAVNTAAGIIYSNLHFSRPDEGPLRNYETWMPDFMAGLANGINSNLYQIEGAVGNVADRLVVKPEYSTEGMFTAAASNDLQEYNVILVNTVELYRQLAEQMHLCSLYSLGFNPRDNELLNFGTNRNEVPQVEVPPNNTQTDSGKPDQLVIPITIGEEQIETVVVDLLRREVRM